jgi:hypothetical protein
MIFSINGEAYPMNPDIRKAITDDLTVSVDVAGAALGLKSKTARYAAIKAGAIPSIRIGGRITVPTAPLRKMLGIEDRAVA